MTRVQRQIVWCMLIGLVLGVLSAVLPALLADLHKFKGMNMSPAKGVAFPSYVPGDWGPSYELAYYPAIDVGYSMVGVVNMTGGRRGENVIGAGLWRHEFGWPMRAARYEEFKISSDVVGVDSASVASLEREFAERAGWRVGVELPTWAGRAQANGKPRRLPTVPMWGFVANTALFAAVSWVVAAGPWELRRALRAKKGLCVKCAYPVVGLGRCPECGREVAG